METYHINVDSSEAIACAFRKLVSEVKLIDPFEDSDADLQSLGVQLSFTDGSVLTFWSNTKKVNELHEIFMLGVSFTNSPASAIPGVSEDWLNQLTFNELLTRRLHEKQVRGIEIMSSLDCESGPIMRKDFGIRLLLDQGSLEIFTDWERVMPLWLKIRSNKLLESDA